MVWCGSEWQRKELYYYYSSSDGMFLPVINSSLSLSLCANQNHKTTKFAEEKGHIQVGNSIKINVSHQRGEGVDDKQVPLCTTTSRAKRKRNSVNLA